MSNSEEDIMIYTPLKRKKIKTCDSLYSSQASKSQGVHLRKRVSHPIANSQTVKGSKIKIIKTSQSHQSQYSVPNCQKLPPVSNETGSFLSISKHSHLLTLTKGSQKNKNNKAPRSNLSKVTQNSYDGKIAKTSFTKLNDYDDGINQKITCVPNILDDDTPDIDLTQIDNSDIFVKPTSTSKNSECMSSCRKFEEKALSLSSGLSESNSTLIFHSSLNEKAKLDNVEVLSQTSDSNTEIDSVGSLEILEGICTEKAFVHSDDDFTEPVHKEMEKVNSWLTASMKHLTPLQVKVAGSHIATDKTTTNISSRTDVATHCVSSVASNTVQNIETTESQNPSTVTESCEALMGSELKQKRTEEAKPTACIHLHFHLHTPQKFVQPTIEHFFGQPCKTSSTSADLKCHPQNSGSNGTDVIKAWKTIMDSMKGKKNDSRIQSKILQNENSSRSSGPSTAARFDEAKSSNGPHTCPFYKFVEDTNFVVDAFSYGYISGVSVYFLSHFHYDHYKGLHKNFCKVIYCSQVTANLVRLKIGIQNRFLHPLPLEEPRVIDGVEVTLYDANHCPGAVMFLFRMCTGKTFLHVGDFRAHPSMETIGSFWDHSLDVLYLDTTYLDPTHDFSSQEDVLDKCIRIVREHVRSNSDTLFLVGSYTIGKEKVFKAIASELNCKIYAPTTKRNVLHCLGDQQITERLSNNKFEAQVHVVTMAELSVVRLRKYMETMQPTFKILVAMRPTGWEHSSSLSDDLEHLHPKQLGNIYVYGIPYSEHSSYYELQRFVQFVQPKKIIPTVNNETALRRKKMEDIFRKWQAEAEQLFSRRKKS